MTGRGYEKRDGERGQVLATTVIAFVAICALVAVAADTGLFFDHRRRMQTGVDSAAMAGAEQLRRAASATQIESAAFNAAATNGFTNGVNGAQVAVNHPPTSGFYAGNDAFVEAVISQVRPTTFMGILGFQTATVSTRAVAGAKAGPACIYAMDPTAASAFNVNGGASVTATCGIVDDSSSSNAMNSSGGSSSVTATSIAVTGNVTGCCYSPTPQTGVPPEPDPFAQRAAPVFSGCDYTKFKVTGGTKILTPGVYCDGIDITGGSTVTFSPGLYVLNGGGLSVSGNSTLNGTGVTFYNTASGSNAYKPVSISGGTIGTLSAPTSGPMEAMLFFQDRGIRSSQTNTISGGSTLNLAGAVYFLTTPLNFSGNSSGDADYTILVASLITFTGASRLNADYGSLQNGDPITRVALAE
ncbi:MAG: hypothetical protein E6J59_19300 [Deltaproteobacteria bacterium]|nr:MAG: hypothetical protein E6J59_19300 [Deltaproteobacteria bacterium]